MRFFEHESRAILRRAGIAAGEWGVAATAAEARTLAERVGGPVVIKSQVLAGGRAKAGGVRFAGNPDEAEQATRAVLARRIAGQQARGVVVDRRLPIKREYYAGVVWDHLRRRPLVLFSDQGGTSIEELAGQYPDRVVRRHASNVAPFSLADAAALLGRADVNPAVGDELAQILTRLVRVFLDCDLTIAEINPLAGLTDGRLVALDAHMELDDDARPRQRDLLRELGVADDDRRETQTPTAFELAGQRIDARGPTGHPLKLTEFDGNLGLLIGAGGGALVLLDAVLECGGRPANFCEIGGNPSPEKISALIKLLLTKPGVEKIAMMMTVVMNTRADRLAEGAVRACLELGMNPAERIAVFRVPGAQEEAGYELLERYGVECRSRSTSLQEAARLAVDKVAAA